MSLETNALIDAVASTVMRSGYFERVNKHESKVAPGTGLTADVWVQTLEPSRNRSGLSATAVRVAFTLRIWLNMVHEPQDDIDPICMEAADWIMNGFTGDLTLDGVSDDAVELDLLGADGIPLRADAGYIPIGGSLQRIYDITIPLVVYDAWGQSR